MNPTTVCSPNRSELIPRYPDVSVQLVGEDGNAGAIMGRVTTALRRNKVPLSEVNKFRLQAMSGSYDELLQTVMEWVDVD